MGWAGETNSGACAVCCSELSGRGGNPLVEGLLGGVVCDGRGATCSITLGGRWIRGCLLANTSSRICRICFKKSTSRRISADTTPVPLRCGSVDAIVAICAAGRRLALRQATAHSQSSVPNGPTDAGNQEIAGAQIQSNVHVAV